MLVNELIYRYNDERPNEIEDLRKLAYIRAAERFVLNEVILTHEWDEDIKAQIDDVLNQINEDEMIEAGVSGNMKAAMYTNADYNKYFDAFDMNTELFVKEPYDDLYFHYIDMKIASAQNEAKRYNAAAEMYNNAYISFQDYYNRTHMPKSMPLKVAYHQLL